MIYQRLERMSQQEIILPAEEDMEVADDKNPVSDDSIKRLTKKIERNEQSIKQIIPILTRIGPMYPLSNKDAWNKYYNDTYGFTLSFPGQLEDEMDDYIRMQNYSSQTFESMFLTQNEYYLEIWISEITEDTESCTAMLPDGEKVAAGEVSGVRGKIVPEGGDSGGNRFILCVEHEGKKVSFSATENSEEGKLAYGILDTVVFE